MSDFKKIMSKTLFPLLLLVLPLSMINETQAAYSNLYNFGDVNDEGKWPSGNLIEQSGLLYGMTPYGGISNCGTIFQYNLSDQSAEVLFSFGGDEGKFPMGSLTLYNGRFYGLTSRGGAHDLGVIFEVETNGNNFIVRHDFDETDPNNGSFPWGSLVEDNGYLYGMTCYGGVTNQGTVFRFDPATFAYTNLHSFAGGEGDGRFPQGDVLITNNLIYGLTAVGGVDGNGVVFSMALDGSAFQTLYEFSGGADGANPCGGLIEDNGCLYGMARQGLYAAGVIFSVPAAGGNLNVLHSFTAAGDDGADPYGSLTKYGSKFYGVTRFGGAHSQGTIFSLGGTYTNVYEFSSGGEPYCTLLPVGSNLYGMAFNEGVSNKGCIFQITADHSDVSATWMAMSWIDGGAFSSTMLGDENYERMYIQHSAGSGLPDSAFIGYGRSDHVDDETWTWKPMNEYGLLSSGTDYEYTASVSRATVTGTLYVAAKFIKGHHTYYTLPGFNEWGDWNTALYATNLWTVTELPSPSGVSVAFTDATTAQLDWTRYSDKYTLVFRKEGVDPEFELPEGGTAYTTGVVYEAQGACVYYGPATTFMDDSVDTNNTYHYVLYTDNNYYYSEGVEISTSDENPDGDDDNDNLPNWWEDQYFGDNTSAVTNSDSDADGHSNWQEFIARTDPTDPADIFSVNHSTYVEGVGVTTNYGADLVKNGGFSNPGSSDDGSFGTAQNWESGYPDDSGTRWGNAHRASWKNHTTGTTSNHSGIISGQWMGSSDGGMLQRNAVSEGTDYRMQGWFWIEPAWVGDNAFKLEFMNGSGVVIGGVTNDLSSVGDDWLLISLKATAPAGTVTAQVGIQSDNVGTGGTMYFDDITLEPVIYSSTDTFDVEFLAKTGRVYRVDFNDDLGAPVSPWIPLQTNITVTTEQTYTVTDTSLSGISLRSYRVGVELP